LLDRIIRGRVWIPLFGVLLAGIVAMQVEVLKLNAGIGRSLERGTALQSQNEVLHASVASLGDDQRIESLAARMGLVMPAPAAIKFLAPGQPGDAQRAIANIQQPDDTSFVSQLALNDASASASDPAATTAIVPTTSTTATTSATGATDTTAPADAAPSTQTTGSPADTTGSSATPAQPAPTDTTSAPSLTSGSAAATQTTPAAVPTQTDQGVGSQSGSGGGVAPASGGVTATSPGP
jgi:hypothetical protein